MLGCTRTECAPWCFIIHIVAGAKLARSTHMLQIGQRCGPTGRSRMGGRSNSKSRTASSCSRMASAEARVSAEK